MLIGEFITPIGEKNRIALPKKLRDELSDELIVTRGYEHCLIVVDQARWLALVAEIDKNPLFSLTVRDTKRFLLGGAYTLRLDKQGRFVVPEGLMQYAGIRESVTWVGVGNWIEIWDTGKWTQKLDYLAENSTDIADRLS